MAYQNSDEEGLVSNIITDCLDRLLSIEGKSLSFQSNRAPGFFNEDGEVDIPGFPVISHNEFVEDMEALGIRLTYQPFDMYFHTVDNEKKETFRFVISAVDISEDGFDQEYTAAFFISPENKTGAAEPWRGTLK